MIYGKEIVGIMATTEQGIIGSQNGLPWNYPEELSYFKAMTHHHTIIMGHHTYHSTPKTLLKNRPAIVFSNQKDLLLDDATVVNSIKECLEHIKSLKTQNKIFMVGGGHTAHVFLEHNLLSSFILTKIHKPYPGDAYLNLQYFETWPKSILKSCKEYTIYHLINPKKTISDL